MNISHFLKAKPTNTIILVFDLIGLLVCFNVAHYLRIHELVTSHSTLFILMASTLLCLYTLNTYTIETANKALRVISRTIIAVILALIIAVLIGFIIGRDAFMPIFGRTILFVAFGIFLLWSCLVRYLMTRFGVNNMQQSRWLFIGDDVKASRLQDDFKKHKHSGELITLIDSNQKAFNSQSQYSNLIEDSWQGVIIDTLSSLSKPISNDLLQQRLRGKKIFTLTEFYSKQWTKVPIFNIAEQWLMDVDGFSLLEDSVNYKLKRLFDFLLACILSLICIPVMLILAIIVKATSPGPALFIQKRVGIHSKTYHLYKFRTMHIDAEKDGPKWTTQDDPRITKVGKFLRQTRLDEIPQIYNVLLGTMSFIGPRPERPEFVTDLEKEIPYYDLRHLVKPGITGWAQVMYDYGSSVDDAREKLQYDLFYIKNQSILLDSIILLKTLKTVLNAKGR